MTARMWRVTESADGSGEPVFIVGSNDSGMVSVMARNSQGWFTPDTAERMAEALVNAARATRGR